MSSISGAVTANGGGRPVTVALVPVAVAVDVLVQAPASQAYEGHGAR